MGIHADAIAHNVRAVRDHITALIAQRPGADPVRLIAVIKSASMDEVTALVAAGITDVAENRVQSASDKQKASGRMGLRWHLIGHLQSNKANQAAALFDMVHSIDSLEIAQKLNAACQRQNKVMPVLIQVKVAQEETKYGIPPGQLAELLESVSVLPYLKVRGLMAMASFTTDTDQVRTEFRSVRRLFNQFRLVYNDFDTLSMGMSQDYPLAILEGSTLIRIGQRLIKSEDP